MNEQKQKYLKKENARLKRLRERELTLDDCRNCMWKLPFCDLFNCNQPLKKCGLHCKHFWVEDNYDFEGVGEIDFGCSVMSDDDFFQHWEWYSDDCSKCDLFEEGDRIR